MGNCLASPLDNHSSSAVQPSNPVSPTGGLPILAHDHEDTSKKRRSNVNIAEKEAPPAGGVLEDVALTGEIVTPNLKMFTYSELKIATRNFRPDTLVGEGGFGRVFKGWVDERTCAPSKVGDGMAVAVKKSNPDSVQGLKEWQAEVKFLGKFSHPNLVKLLGYCWEEKQFLLVYEYMQKGSLESHLFRNAVEPLSWDIRLKIAIGAARGLAFLHTTEKQVIYRDFKASNILLDRDFNPKLSDFGLAKLGPINGDSHVTTRIVGTFGYAAPEYMATGHLYVRSDVYGFGVVLLEMLTGQRVLDYARPNGRHNLVEWAMPFLPNKNKVKKIMDPGLERKYPSKAALQAAQLILRCLESDPKNRPHMVEVLATLQQISATKMSPKESRASAKQTAAKRSQQNSEKNRGRGLGPNNSPLQNRFGGNGAGAGARAPCRSPLL